MTTPPGSAGGSVEEGGLHMYVRCELRKRSICGFKSLLTSRLLSKVNKKDLVLHSSPSMSSFHY